MDEHGSPVLDRNECQRAFPVIQKEFPDMINNISFDHSWAVNPKGCFIGCRYIGCEGTEGEAAYWNPHSTGGRGEKARQICKESKIWNRFWHINVSLVVIYKQKSIFNLSNKHK